MVGRVRRMHVRVVMCVRVRHKIHVRVDIQLFTSPAYANIYINYTYLSHQNAHLHVYVQTHVYTHTKTHTHKPHVPTNINTCMCVCRSCKQTRTRSLSQGLDFGSSLRVKCPCVYAFCVLCVYMRLVYLCVRACVHTCTSKVPSCKGDPSRACLPLFNHKLSIPSLPSGPGPALSSAGGKGDPCRVSSGAWDAWRDGDGVQRPAGWGCGGGGAALRCGGGGALRCVRTWYVCSDHETHAFNKWRACVLCRMRSRYSMCFLHRMCPLHTHAFKP